MRFERQPEQRTGATATTTLGMSRPKAFNRSTRYTPSPHRTGGCRSNDGTTSGGHANVSGR